MITNETQRFGSAEAANLRDLKKAGLFRRSSDGLMTGFLGKRPIFIPGQGGCLLVGGARTQKLASTLGYTLCGFGYQGNIIVNDPKGELAAVSQNQTHTGKHTVHWNPFRLHGLPHDRINPLGHIRPVDPAIITKLANTCATLLPLSGGGNARFFERTSRKYAGGAAATCLELFDELTFLDWNHAINLMIQGGDAWESFATQMRNSRFALAREAEAEIAQGRKSESGGFRGAMGELAQAFQAFADPILMDAVSPPFDFSYEELLSSEHRFNVYLMTPAEYISEWEVPLRMHFTSAFIFKREAPTAPGQLWVIDEAGQLGANPMLEQAFSYGAGIGVRPWAVFQSLDQLNRVGKDAKGVILSSSAVRQFFGVRDLDTARIVSAMCGEQTLEYNDDLQQMQAAQRKHQAAIAMMSGQSFMQAAMAYRHEAAQEKHRAVIRRPLRTPDEVLNSPPQAQYVFCDQVKKVIYCERRPYYEQHWMAGKFHPNPFYPPSDTVKTKNRWFGYSRRRVLEMDAPPRLRHLRQYRDRPVSYIEGFAP